MSRLLKYLLYLVSREFWGEITIKFRGGKVHAVIVTANYLETTVPEVDDADPAYRQVMQDVIVGKIGE